MGPMRGIVFDLDGTLVDSLSVTIAAFNAGFVSQGGKRHTPQEVLSYFGQGEGDIFSRVVGPERSAAAYEVCRQYLDDHIDDVPLHLGVPELLNEVDLLQIPVSIFTGRSWQTTEMILKHHGILDRFLTVVASDHVGSSKPSPEGLLLALKRMKLEPAEVLMVGDSPLDIRAAHRAGAQGVAALWDLQADRKRLEIERPHHWSEKPGRVIEIFRTLTGR